VCLEFVILFKNMKKWIKYIITFVSVVAFRLMPFRAPNVEPIMATIMPLGKTYSKFMVFIFGFLGIAIFDSMTSGFGIWTLVTAISYGLVGLGSSYYFKNRSGWKSYASYAIFATLLYDAVTGLTIGPIFFHQSFFVSFVGQIPFTVLHLLGNVSFAIVLSPMIERWLVKEEEISVVREEIVLVV
jgi:energy-coupling factor transport system substrate-specific component